MAIRRWADRADPAGDGGPAPMLVVGIGNRNRGDDGVGPLVIDGLRHRLEASQDDGGQPSAPGPGVRLPDRKPPELVVVDGDPCDLTLRWHPGQAVVIVDAMHSGREPGAIVTVDGLLTPLPVGRPAPSGQKPLSSHGIGLAEAIELGRHLGRLPRSLTIFGIEAATFAHGAALSRPVAVAVAAVIDRIGALIDSTDPGAEDGGPVTVRR